MALGPIFMGSVALEPGSKIDGFSGWGPILSPLDGGGDQGPIGSFKPWKQTCKQQLQDR